MPVPSRAPLVAYSREGTAAREIASGIDAFYLSGFCEIPVRLWTHLATLKMRAAENEAGVPFVLGAASFVVSPTGLPRYPVRLDHPNCAVGITASAALPALRFQPRSEFLQSHGAAAAAEWFRRVFEPVVGDLRVGVSRLDLFIDTQGWEPEPDDRLRFVTRAKSRITFEDSEKLTGFVIGRRSSGVTFRIYNKIADMEKKHVGFWPEVWAERFDREQPVWRAEAEFHRSALKQFGANTPEEAIELVGGMWRYVTESWLSLRVPTNDMTSSRWPVDEAWKIVQQASLVHDSVAAERITAANNRAMLDWWLSRLVGAVAACSVLVGAQTATDAIAAVPALVELYELQGGRSLEVRMQERRTPERAA